MADPYATLGISRTASEADIKSAYRKLAKELHPDRNKDNPAAADRFSRATQAYDLLSDKAKRAQFDRGEIDGDGNPKMPYGMGGGGSGPYGGGSPFGGGFGGARPGRPPNGGPSQGYDGFQNSDDLDLGDLFEGLFGRSGGNSGRTSSGGFGRKAPPPPRRKGANINYKLAVPFIDAATRKKQRITLADGKTIDLSLPAGVETGTQMRLKGKGHKGAAGSGDGIVTVEVQPHAYFSRHDDDVRIDLPITLDEAINGGRVKVPTVDGPVMMTVAPGSSSGKLLRLKGKGFTRKGGGRGDQLVALQIQLPDDLGELRKKLEGWSDTATARARFAD